MNMILDPSYGKEYSAGATLEANEQAWEDASLEEWHYRIFPIGGGAAYDLTGVVAHVSGRAEATFS